MANKPMKEKKCGLCNEKYKSKTAHDKKCAFSKRLDEEVIATAANGKTYLSGGGKILLALRQVETEEALIRSVRRRPNYHDVKNGLERINTFERENRLSISYDMDKDELSVTYEADA
jgi:hypothetical protein